MKVGDEQVSITGTAFYERHATLSEVLRVRLDSQEGSPEIIIHEPTWRGRLIPDIHHGCEFCLIPPE